MRYPLYVALALGLFTTGCETATRRSASALDSTTSEAEIRALAAQGDLDARASVASTGWIRGEAGAAEQLAAVANDGSARAADVLASAYQSGRGVEKDYAEAARWLAVAARLGDEDAARDLAHYRASV